VAPVVAVFATVLVIKPVGGVVAAGIGSTWLALSFRLVSSTLVMLFVVVLLKSHDAPLAHNV
jgi:hypothetical protein